MADPLDRLADLAGLAISYDDAWGQRRALSDANKRSLLAALGVAASDDRAIAAATERLDEAPWRRWLAPVLVRRRGRALTVPITRPAGADAGTIQWTVEIEGGEVRRGNATFADLALEETRHLPGMTLERRTLLLGLRPPLGYHCLRVVLGGEEASARLIVVPARCYMPSALDRDGRGWGFAVQLYALRSQRNWGMGDFTDLAALAAIAAQLGADAIGLNPIHALFPHNAAHCGPYSPSTRRFLNTLYIDVEAVPDFAACPEAQRSVAASEFQRELAALREQDLVDYVGVAAHKRPVLEQLFAHFRTHHLARDHLSERGRDFHRFRAAGGDALARLATFEALAEHFGGHGWRDWPPAYLDPTSPDVARFAEANAARITFFQYLQWLASLQLAAAQAACRTAGMCIGLYLDLALGADSGGAEVWSERATFADGATLGAPPDDWNLKGQNWGIPPFNPIALADTAYQPFVATLRTNMRNGGALRIDHVMALQRLYWIPPGQGGDQGGYVHYPLEDMLGILALESHRHRCLVVGEDLGTVPHGFRTRMRAANVLSYRPIYFQRDARGAFLAPERYPKLSAAVVGTHDLATLPGYWSGHDLDVRGALKLYPSRESEAQARGARKAERAGLLTALMREGLIEGPQADPDAPAEPALVEAFYRFLARTPSKLVMAHIEDALGVEDQINVPGTIEDHPNWRRKLPIAIERLRDEPRVQGLAQALNTERPRSHRR